MTVYAATFSAAKHPQGQLCVHMPLQQQLKRAELPLRRCPELLRPQLPQQQKQLLRLLQWRKPFHRELAALQPRRRQPRFLESELCRRTCPLLSHSHGA